MLAPYWRRLIVISVALVGLALFAVAEYGLGNTIAQGHIALPIIVLAFTSIVFVAVGHPFGGYAIWFFLSCYLTLYNSILPAMFSFDLIMVGLLTVVLILRALARKEALSKPTIEEVLLILYFIYAYMVRRDFDPSHMVAELKYLFLSPPFFYFIAKGVIREKKHVYWLIILIIATGFSWALMGIYEQISQKMWISPIAGVDVQMYAGIRSAGPAGFYYLYGNMLILTILLCLHVLGWLQRLYSKLIVAAICLITAVGLYYGYSRAPYIAFGLSLIIMLFLAKHTRRFHIIGISMLIMAVVTMVLPRVASDRVLQNRFLQPTTGRAIGNITSMNMFKANYLFGVGARKYGENIPLYVEHGHHVSKNKVSGMMNDYTVAHSEYYFQLCELGSVGALLYFGTYAFFLYRILKIRAKLSSKDIIGKDLASVAFAITIALLLTMATDQFGAYTFMYAIIFAVFAMVRRTESLASSDGATKSSLTPI